MKYWGLVAVLVMWAGIVAWRRRREQSRYQPRMLGRKAGDDIDYDTLEQAEQDVRDLDTDAKGRPLDNAVGDDWGPGTPKPPYT